MTKRTLIVVAAMVLAVYSYAGTALAASQPPTPSSTTFTAGFAPDKLGAYSTIELGFHLHRPGGALPPPLAAVEFLLPAGVSLTTSKLGLDICPQTTIENAGSRGCLPDSVMGYGSATLVAPTEVEGILEPAGVTILEAPPVDRHTTLLFDVNGSSPVISQVLVLGQMLDASSPFEGNLSAAFPITPGLPGEKDVSLISLQAGIGSKGVTYYNRVHGVSVPYTPQGVVVPSRCPIGGFPFEAKFRFADGSSESVATISACPSGSGHRRGRG